LTDEIEIATSMPPGSQRDDIQGCRKIGGFATAPQGRQRAARPRSALCTISTISAAALARRESAMLWCWPNSLGVELQLMPDECPGSAPRSAWSSRQSRNDPAD
jgi:hypothetical protein